MPRVESTLFNMILALFVICFVSALLLGVTYVATKDKIEENRRAKDVAALKGALPEFDNNPVAEKYLVKTPAGELAFYPAKKGSILVGTAVESFSLKGYSGKIRIMIGFLPDGTIFNIEVLEHKETPGLGAKIESMQSDFGKQFKNKNPKNFLLKVKKDGGPVDAITAATISSRAYCEAVKLAYDALMQQSKSGDHSCYDCLDRDDH
jgi:Na+-translocating ferredoxin:NAD+ oxidoreductase subunit G